MNSLLRGISLLPGVFLTTGSDRVKVLSERLAKQTTELENLKNNLSNKNYECNLQASQLSAQKRTLGNLITQLESKVDNLRRQVELVNTVRREAQTSDQKHQSEIKQLKQKIGKKSNAIKDLQKEIQKKTNLMQEQEKTIEENALEIRKKSEILWEWEKQIADNAVLIQTITQQQKELKECYEKESQKLKDLQEDGQKQTQKMKFLQEYNKSSTKKIHDLERNMDTKTRMINEFNENMKIKNNMITKLENIIEDHVKNIQKQEAIIGMKNIEIEELRIELKVKSTQIEQIASQLGEKEQMKMEMKMKQLELQSLIPEVKYLRARFEEQKEDMCCPAGGLKKPLKRERQNKSPVITHSSKRFKKTED